MRHHSHSLTLAALVAAASLTLACEAREPRNAEPGEAAPSVQTDPVAERGFIRLTGCVRPDAAPGRYVLAGVATAGVLSGGEDDRQERSWTAEDGTTTEAQVATRAASTYQLIPSGDQDLSRYEGQRVTVRGRLAAEQPAGTAGQSDTARTEAGRQSAEVVADAPPLRGFHVESIDTVAESCQ